MANINLNFGGGKNGPARQPNPSAPQSWYRRVGGDPWKALSTCKFMETDEDDIDAFITSVQSGAVRLNPAYNPYKKKLTSGRILTFRWAVNQSSHVCDVWDIKLRGKTNTALLMKF